jgi:hypothetical protein
VRLLRSGTWYGSDAPARDTDAFRQRCRRHRHTVARSAASSTDASGTLGPADRSTTGPRRCRTSWSCTIARCQRHELRSAPTADGRRLVEAVWDLFEQSGSWPTVGEAAHRLDRRYDLAFEDALPDVPAGLLYGVHPGRIPSDGETTGLTF